VSRYVTLSESGARGRLFIVSGPSGVGKSTLLQRLLASRPGLRFSVSYTTRPRRPQEQEGVHYHFVSRETFERMLEQNAFLEHATFNDHLYGTAAAPITQWVSQGRGVLLDIDVQGAEQLREKRVTLDLPMRFIFILPPSFDNLKERITKRGTENEHRRLERLRAAEDELQQAPYFDLRIVNDDLDVALETLSCAVEVPSV